jgi:hypothetical protein
MKHTVREIVWSIIGIVLSGVAGESLSFFRAISDVDAWFQLGEISLSRTAGGSRVEESEEAWRKVLSYEPRNLFALTHLARIVMADRSSALDSLLRSCTDERTDVSREF